MVIMWHWISDTRNSIVDPIQKWFLVGCDVNIDILVGDLAQLTGINIQVNSALGVEGLCETDWG